MCHASSFIFCVPNTATLNPSHIKQYVRTIKLSKRHIKNLSKRNQGLTQVPEHPSLAKM